MKFNYKNKYIDGLVFIVPDNEVFFEDEMKNYDFPVSRSKTLQSVMGYHSRRIVNDETCISDLILTGFEHLFKKNLISKDDIDALVVVTQTPDQLMPPTSFIIHGKLQLKEETFCIDINQGCAGFVVGLIQAFNLLNNKNINKVALINADVLSRKTSVNDRNSYPLIGDAASITIISNKESENICSIMKVDGSQRGALEIPAGGMKMPSNLETSKLKDCGDGNKRSLDDLVMDGAKVFNFVQNKVPPLIDEILNEANKSKEDIDYFLFHQPNKFMLTKLAQSIGIDLMKMPSDVVKIFGNSSGVTIPAIMGGLISQELKSKENEIIFSGFGVGLTWAALYMKLNKLKFCEKIEHTLEPTKNVRY